MITEVSFIYGQSAPFHPRQCLQGIIPFCKRKILIIIRVSVLKDIDPSGPEILDLALEAPYLLLAVLSPSGLRFQMKHLHIRIIDYQKILFPDPEAQVHIIESNGKLLFKTANIGSKVSRLKITKERVADQLQSFKELADDNINAELTESSIDFSNAKLALEAAQLAAGKISQQTLLNYL